MCERFHTLSDAPASDLSMGAGSIPELSRIQDAATCREWLASIEGREGQRLELIERLLRSLERGALAPDAMFAILEQARVAQIAETDVALREMRGAPVPFSDGAWSRFRTLAHGLRMARNLYKRVHTEWMEAGDHEARAIIQGATDSLATVMPLARALDYQARLIGAAMRMRVTVDPQDWDELCGLARRLRASTFLDERLPDPVPLVRSPTARAVFVYPVLLALSRPELRTVNEVELIDRLSRRWAEKVGFRVDPDGLLRENKHGPTFAATIEHSVRLDTHRLLRSVDGRRSNFNEGEDLAAAAADLKVPETMPPEAARRVLEELRICWSGAYRPVRRLPAPCKQAALSFGFPKVYSIDAAIIDRAHAMGADDPRLTAMITRSPYLYGNREPDTIMRLANACAAPGAATAVESSLAKSESVTWHAIEGDCAWFERLMPLPAAAVGALVVILPQPRTEQATHSRRPGGVVGKLMIGRVVAVVQDGSNDPKRARHHHLGIHFWPGEPVLVGVQTTELIYFEDSFLLPGDLQTREPPSLVIPAGRYRINATAVLREPGRDLRIRFDALVERARGFDRVRFTPLGTEIGLSG